MEISSSGKLWYIAHSGRRLKLAGDVLGSETSRVRIQRRPFSAADRRYIYYSSPKNGEPRAKTSPLRGEFGLFDFTMSRPSIIFGKSVRLIYYSLPINRFKNKSANLIYYALAANRF